MTSGNKPLSEPMLTQVDIAIVQSEGVIKKATDISTDKRPGQNDIDNIINHHWFIAWC